MLLNRSVTDYIRERRFCQAFFALPWDTIHDIVLRGI